MIEEISISEYKNRKWPNGGEPSDQTIRRDIKARRVPGKIVPLEKKSRYIVFWASTPEDSEINDIINELES